LLLVFFALFGGVAQLGERRVRNAKVEGSIPFSSTIPKRPVVRLRPLFLGLGSSVDRASAS
jgi:hypothetical protein